MTVGQVSETCVDRLEKLILNEWLKATFWMNFILVSFSRNQTYLIDFSEPIVGSFVF